MSTAIDSEKNVETMDYFVFIRYNFHKQSGTA